MSGVLDRYPRKVEIRKHLVVEIKPLDIEHIPDLTAMFKTLDDRAVEKIPVDVTDANYERGLKRRLEDGRTHILAAWKDGAILGEIALYPRQSSWTKHTAAVVFVSHPEYRRYGLATILFEEMLPWAQSLGIEKVYAELSKDHVDGIKMLKHFGFTREATLKDHIKDRYGRYHDMRIYSLDMERAHKEMEALIADFSDYSG